MAVRDLQCSLHITSYLKITRKVFDTIVKATIRNMPLRTKGLAAGKILIRRTEGWKDKKTEFPRFFFPRHFGSSEDGSKLSDYTLALKVSCSGGWSAVNS